MFPRFEVKETARWGMIGFGPPGKTSLDCLPPDFLFKHGFSTKRKPGRSRGRVRADSFTAALSRLAYGFLPTAFSAFSPSFTWPFTMAR